VLSFVEDHPDTAGLFDEAIFLGESKRGPSEPLSPGLRAELLKAGYTPAQLQYVCVCMSVCVCLLANAQLPLDHPRRMTEQLSISVPYLFSKSSLPI
jgi:hypothetical protein